jgi:NAD(P)-dependent dehydrogenase (short-subunit alcohol dehydrogenase family)
MSKPFAIVTGASSGIGLELATVCAQEGFDLLIAADRPEIEAAGDGDVVSGWKNKLQTAMANVTPAGVLAEQHRKMAEPGSAKKAKS